METNPDLRSAPSAKIRLVPHVDPGGNGWAVRLRPSRQRIATPMHPSTTGIPTTHTSGGRPGTSQHTMSLLSPCQPIVTRVLPSSESTDCDCTSAAVFTSSCTRPVCTSETTRDFAVLKLGNTLAIQSRKDPGAGAG